MMTDNKLTTLYSEQLAFTDHLCATYNPMEVAAIMMVQSLSIYKTAMSAKEYDLMIDAISNSRDKVMKFEKAIVQ